MTEPAARPAADLARLTPGADLPSMWRELAALGRSRRTGGYRRFAWTAEDADCRAWFRAQAELRGLRYEVDGNGNQWAWLGDPAAVAPGEAVATGSHLDSVPDGGAFDGPLGVVTAFAALDELHLRGVQLTRPLAVVGFVDEEGARFGLSCVGSRLATGLLTPQQAAALTDGEGVTLPQAMERAGLDPEAIGPTPQLLGRLGAFVELHIEQARLLAQAAAPIGIASAIWPHGRWRFDFHGAGDHAGTTPLEERHDPMLTYANTVLAARKKARLAGALATFGRVEAAPNAVNAIPTRVSGWLDSRAADEETLAGLVEEIERAAITRGERDGVQVAVDRESFSGAVEFATTLRERLAARLAGPAVPVPILPTGAGHDAGILADTVPTAMLYVRNPTGISHAPPEHATEDDCLAGVTALADVLEELAC